MNRRFIIWTSVAAIAVLTWLLIPSGPKPLPIPTGVKLEGGISRRVAERLYGHHQWILRHFIWNEFRQLEFKQAWRKIQVARYSKVQSIRQDTTNSATITSLCSIPDQSTSTNQQKFYYRYGIADVAGSSR